MNQIVEQLHAKILIDYPYYYCIVFEKNKNQSDFLWKETVHNAEKLLQGSHIFFDNKKAYLLVGKKEYLYFDEQEETNWIQFMESHKLHAGFSYLFSDLSKTNLQFAHAQQAVKLGNLYQKERFCWYYSELMILEIIESAAINQNLVRFCDPRFIQLVFYDESHQSDFVRSLEQIIRYTGDSAVVANKLFIHRNTLYYRVQHLENIFHIDLRNQGDFFTIRISIGILLYYAKGDFSKEAFSKILHENGYSASSIK